MTAIKDDIGDRGQWLFCVLLTELSVNEIRKGIGALPTTHRLDCGFLKSLWREVHDFWSGRDMVLKGSKFV
jgi:hypothetical protein